MPPIRQKSSVEDQLADALRRIGDLELKLDKSKQATFVALGGIWKYLGSPGAEVLIDQTAAPDLQDFFVYVGTGSPHSYFEIWDQGAGLGDSFITLTTPGDMNLNADGDLNISPNGNTRLSLPTSDPGVSGAMWNDGGTVKVSP